MTVPARQQSPHVELESAPLRELRAVEPELTPPVVRSPRSSGILYAACARALEHEAVIWDVGCGDGSGTVELVGNGRTVIGIDPDPAAVESCRNVHAGATFMTSLPSVTSSDEAPDLIILSDVLGYVQDPDLLLLLLSKCSKPTTQLWIWEPRAEPTQQLPSNKLRAYSNVELAELVAAGGWLTEQQPEVCVTCAVLTARPGPAKFIRTLSALISATPELEPVDTSTLPPALATAVHMRRAQAALRAKEGDAASAHFLAILDVDPRHTGALCGLTQLALNYGSLPDAVRLLKTCLEVDPTHVEAMRLWAAIIEMITPDERLTAYQTLANLNPGDATALSSLAQLHAETGNPSLAIQDLERLRRYHPAPNLGLSLTMGWLLHSVGRHSDAEVEARLASLLEPDGSDVHELLSALGYPTSEASSG